MNCFPILKVEYVPQFEEGGGNMRAEELAASRVERREDVKTNAKSSHQVDATGDPGQKKKAKQRWSESLYLSSLYQKARTKSTLSGILGMDEELKTVK